jgi:hypothetical protein
MSDTPNNSALSAYLSRILRIDRDHQLGTSDWTQMSDSPLSAEQKAAWAVYRQALRDITEQPGFPLDIQWPVAP